MICRIDKDLCYFYGCYKYRSIGITTLAGFDGKDRNIAHLLKRLLPWKKGESGLTQQESRVFPSFDAV